MISEGIERHTQKEAPQGLWIEYLQAKKTRFVLGKDHYIGFIQRSRCACHLVTSNESRVMIDVGVNIASDTDPMPYFTAPEALPMEKMDAVILTHAHLDHAGMLPVLFRYGYRGPVYCTPPTRDMMLLLQSDYLKVGGSEGKEHLTIWKTFELV